ncbi:Dabb family protein [uncultured Litoreibacter sp.]|uniref:Dabb family protein n=1 Tax=uncultured Litoreibacter sp. TaxID=1392394 RepID=UPI00262DCD86|nr:Dabb family protein [uncultured Litoreibacter sp.]
MILHSVYLRLPQGTDRTELETVMTGLKQLCKDMVGCTGFQHGPNRDFEGKSHGYPYGFIAQFRDRDALATYAENPEHKALGGRLVSLCDGGADGIVVYDIEVVG